MHCGLNIHCCTSSPVTVRFNANTLSIRDVSKVDMADHTTSGTHYCYSTESFRSYSSNITLRWEIEGTVHGAAQNASLHSALFYIKNYVYMSIHCTYARIHLCVIVLIHCTTTYIMYWWRGGSTQGGGDYRRLASFSLCNTHNVNVKILHWGYGASVSRPPPPFRRLCILIIHVSRQYSGYLSRSITRMLLRKLLINPNLGKQGILRTNLKLQ